MDVEVSAPYLLQLLGAKGGTESLAVLTPEAIKTRTFETLRQMSLHGSQQRPLIIEIEDLHWCDNISEECLAWLVESVAGTAILLLLTYRPGYRPPWLDKSYATQIALRHLAPQESVTVVRSARQQHALPEPLEQMIIAKAEGNPFFLEELTRAVLDHADVGTDVTVPDTIQDVLMARIDRLPEASKRLLQTAAVLGREISPPLLEALWDGVQPLVPLLLDLTRQEFLFVRASVEGSVYVFKHALTQEVAYESLLTTRRQTLHAAAGQALETLYALRLEDAYDRLAYHYARADNVAKAVAYLTRVAEKAASHSAHVEAISHLTRALEFLLTLPATPECNQQELTLHIALGASLIATKGYAPLRWSRPIPAPGSSVSTWKTPDSFSRCCAACGIIISCAPSCRRRTPWASSSWPWRSKPRTPRCSWRPTVPWGQRCPSWERQPRRTRTWRRG
jgi:predicted ATPase